MDFSYLSLIGAFAMLVIGLAGYAVLQRLFYIPLRDRYERAKVTGTHGLDPWVFWIILRLINLVALPLLGFVFGHAVLQGFIG